MMIMIFIIRKHEMLINQIKEKNIRKYKVNVEMEGANVDDICC